MQEFNSYLRFFYLLLSYAVRYGSQCMCWLHLHLLDTQEGYFTPHPWLLLVLFPIYIFNTNLTSSEKWYVWLKYCYQGRPHPFHQEQGVAFRANMIQVLRGWSRVNYQMLVT